jgi:hypothetical protein
MRKAVKIAGFVVALGASAGLVAAAASGTGAYFTDSHSGAISASTGGVHVNTGNLNLNFTGLLPGQYGTQDITYQAAGTAPEDIWLVLPSVGADAFKGTGGSAAALGRYGHFAVSGPAGTFTSFNLASAGTGTHAGNSCYVDPVTGLGGSSTEADTTATLVDYCPVPNAILLSSNLPYSQSGTAHITFGVTTLLKDPAAQDQPSAPVALFSIVATQHGVVPSDPNNPPQP